MSDRVYQSPSGEREYQLGEWRLCLNTNCLQRGDNKVELENRLVVLLVFFIEHQGEVLHKERILKTIWPGKVVNDDSLAVAISHLRKALGDDARAPRYIKTLPGVGYQLIASAGAVEVLAQAQGSSAAPLRVKAVGWRYWALGLGALLAMGALWVFLAQSSPPLATGVDAPVKPAPVLSAEAQGRFKQSSLLVDAWDELQLKQAVQGLREFLQQYPDYAPAYTRMAEAKIKLLRDQLAITENCAEVLGLLDKAIQLDAQQQAAWVQRGNTLFWCKRDYPAAGQNYLRAIALNPRDDIAPMQYAQLLLAQGLFVESLLQVEKSRQLNPLNYSVPTVVWIHQMQGRDDRALQELERIGSTEAGDQYFHISAQRVYARLGRAPEAFSHWLWLMRAAGYKPADIQRAEQAFAQGGLAAVNRWLLARRDGADLGQYTPPLSWARYALAAGELEVALGYLQQAFALRQSPLLWAKVDPAYDPLRQDPRFQKILDQISQQEMDVQVEAN